MDRTTKVSLVAQVSSYVAGMEQAAQKTREVGSEAEKLGQKKQALQGVGTAALAMGAVAAAAVGVAVAKFAEFDKQMSAVQAATHETTENMGLLRNAAIAAGADTVYTATEAAQAIENMAKAGVQTADILGGGLTGALSLAAAGGLEVARAGEVAAISMKQFGLEGRDIPHIADLLAAGAGKAAGDVEDMAQALNQSALVANQAGLSIEETTGVLAAFADQGLIGSDAGTSLKTALQRLVPTSKEAKDEMQRLGISAYDANGEFIGAAKFAGNLRDALSDLTPEQRATSEAIIFGSDAVRAANVLYDQGAEGIQKYIDHTDDAGYAAITAATKLDNLAGDVERLGGSFDTALIQTGSAANDVLRGSVQAVTGLVDAYNGLPEPLKAVALGTGGVVGGIGLVGGAALAAVPRIADFKNGLKDLEVSGKGVTLAAGAIGAAVTALVAVISFWSERAAKANTITRELTDTLDAQTGALTGASRAVVVHQLEQGKMFDAAQEAGISQDELTDAVLKGGDAYAKVRKHIDDYQASQSTADTIARVFNGTMFTLNGDLDDLAGSVENSRAAWENETAANAEATAAADASAAAVNALQGAAADAGASVSDLAEQIRGFGSAQLSVNEATRNFEASIDDLTQSVIDNGTSLDVTEAAGRANQSAIDDLAKSTLELAGATIEQTGKQEDANGVIATGRQKLIDMLGQFNITGPAAEAYADKLGLIPGNVNTAVAVTGVDAAETALSNLARTRTAYLSAVVTTNADGETRSNVRTARATGGILPGPPSSKDNMLIHAASGEFVVNARQTQQNRPLLEAINSGSGRVPGYASGGYVSQTATQYAGGGAAPAPVRIEVTSKGGIDLLKYVDVRVASAERDVRIETFGGAV